MTATPETAGAVPARSEQRTGPADLAGRPQLPCVSGCASGAWVPVVRDGRCVAVLALGWSALRPDLSERDHELLRLFARHAGTTIAAITLRHKELEHTRQLSTLGGKLAETREQLTASVAMLEQQTTIRRTLARHTGEQAIADAVHDLTGLAVAVQDPFGNLRCWSGPEQAGHYPKPEPSNRDAVLRQAVHQGRPVRDKDTLVAVARPRQEILGALVLVGLEDDVGSQELFVGQDDIEEVVEGRPRRRIGHWMLPTVRR